MPENWLLKLLNMCSILEEIVRVLNNNKMIKEIMRFKYIMFNFFKQHTNILVYFDCRFILEIKSFYFLILMHLITCYWMIFYCHHDFAYFSL